MAKKNVSSQKEPPLLAVSDKIEVLKEIVVHDDFELNETLFDELLHPFYDTFLQFLNDVKKEKNVSKITCVIQDGEIPLLIFCTQLANNEEKKYTYQYIDCEI